jgi:chorismate synthase
MKNTFGNSLTVTIFGESHGDGLGIVIDGIARGIPVDDEAIAGYLARRRPSSPADTARREMDEYRILSGVFNGRTTGTALAIMIPNTDTRSGDYEYGPARPSHADYAAHCKYHGYEDYRGGGHFSGRITAALVAAGGILLPALQAKGIRIGTHIASCGDVRDTRFEEIADAAVNAAIDALQKKMFPVIDDEAGDKITQVILEAGCRNDSIGGITETAVTGIPAGVGEPWFDSMESMISHAVFSIGAIKGIEFGDGWDMACGMYGSSANDAMRATDGAVRTVTNHNGGINGGITNGMPIVFKCAVKPTPSISQPMDTVNFLTGENTKLLIKGRHDPAIIRRICPVIDSVTAIVISDMLAVRYGTDWLAMDAG